MTTEPCPSATTTPAASGDSTAAADDGWAINLFTACVALAALTCVDAALVGGVRPRLTVLVVAVAVGAERTADARGAIGGAVMAFAFGDGFLQHADGMLGWQTSVDVPFAAGLLVATALGLTAGLVRQAVRRRRRMAPFIALLQATGEFVAEATAESAALLRSPTTTPARTAAGADAAATAAGDAHHSTVKNA